MTHTIDAHFDGKVIIPNEPVSLPVGQPLRIKVELAEGAAPRYAEFLQLAADADDSPSDLAAQHDHYLYGTPKR